MRLRRAKVSGQTACYHVITRTVAGAPLLGRVEKEVFRKMLRKVSRFCGVEVLTFCILSNHVHLLVRVPAPVPVTDQELLERVEAISGKGPAEMVAAVLRGSDATEKEKLRKRLKARMFDVSVFVKELKQRFSIWYNKTHRRFGTLWAERFKSVLIEGRRFALETVAAYIDLNPVRAGVVKDPKDYRFSGYGEACGGGAEARQGLISLLGAKSWAASAADYRMCLFGKGSGPAALGKGHIIPQEAARAVMEAGGKLPLPVALRCRVRYFSDGLALGSKAFLEDFFANYRDLFGKKRTSGARPMLGADWGDLNVARDLRRDVLS
ncbi:MAG: transposase [Puniceicoccaceae bacterium]|nr:MAG: transposase [Puniceicoccaceae bacterium]